MPALPVEEFIAAATWHGSLERADALLAAHPDLARATIHTAAILGDDETVRGFLARDPGAVHATAGPHGGNALTCLCLSKYLRLERRRAEGFLRTATALLDAGADPNGGFWTAGDHPEFETPLYGAAGVAHHAPLTRLLLERGADPNDEEVVYHAPEGRDNAALEAVVETGRLTPDSLATMLARKIDWHDFGGIRYLLARGADPNRLTRWGRTALHQAVLRDNDRDAVALLLDHGADPSRRMDGRTAVALAARRGRRDLLELLARRGVPVELAGPDRLVAACARDDAAAIRALSAQEPDLVADVRADGGRLLAAFAGVGNTDGVRRLLDLGLDVDAVHPEGDVYLDFAPHSTALHMAAWRARHDTVELLIARGADVNARDGRGRTPLALAVKACVDSFWTELRSPRSVAALLAAGASRHGVPHPSGYDEVDALLAGA